MRVSCKPEQLRDVVRLEQTQVRPDGTEGAEALALVELHLRDLDVARRVVVDDHRAGDELVQVRVGDSTGAVMSRFSTRPSSIS